MAAIVHPTFSHCTAVCKMDLTDRSAGMAEFSGQRIDQPPFGVCQISAQPRLASPDTSRTVEAWQEHQPDPEFCESSFRIQSWILHRSRASSACTAGSPRSSTRSARHCARAGWVRPAGNGSSAGTNGRMTMREGMAHSWIGRWFTGNGAFSTHAAIGASRPPQQLRKPRSVCAVSDTNR